ncbi:Thiamine-monophosphate kinase [hydrothermal vent metagenome]|uniref:Thiamine-monophosphate kinase n=1 Tax=hydrothermal vent metagenome TaxID=652676 RepID=A0A3B0ZU65_9ZZZZ
MSNSKLESEFQIIKQYFDTHQSKSNRIIKGIGDDAAVIDITEQSTLVISVDTLISGVHFPSVTTAYDIGYKSLAVNLSDLAAMGASPSWFTLALTMPENNSSWVKAFSHGLFDLAQLFNIDLIGGDTTKGQLSITLQIAGYADKNNIMYRHSAQFDDDIYTSGYIGDAGAGLLAIMNDYDLDSNNTKYLLNRLNQPSPRVELGQQIALVANACIDVSDGLIADLGHIIGLSNCGAVINVEQLPISEQLKSSGFVADWQQLALGSGDDYELCFTANKKHRVEIENISKQLNVPITKIGTVDNEKTIRCYLNNKPYRYQTSGYEHFKEQK